VRLVHPEVRDLDAEDLYDLYDAPGPHLRAGFVSSVDGIVAIEGRSGALGSPADKASFRALRTVCDAVVVGAGTVRAEDYGPVRYADSARTWRSAHDRAEQPPIVIVSRRGRLDPQAKVLQGPVILAVPEDAEVPEGIDVVRTTDPVALRAALHERGLARLLCEGGPSLLTSFLQAGTVDELFLTTAPLAVGDGAPLLSGAAPTALEMRSLIVDDPGVLLTRWAVVPSQP
jgi:5-amino-6-(5-phosphoribosylamino)uracil reductase